MDNSQQTQKKHREGLIIPERADVLRILEESAKPITLDKLLDSLKVTGQPEKQALGRRLRAMERDGQILQNRRGLYCLASEMEMVAGRVVGHPYHFGFVRPEGGGAQLYLSPREMRKAMHGDRVMVRVIGLDRRGRRQAVIIDVLERSARQIVGRYFIEQGIGFVVPDDKRITQNIAIPADQAGNAKPGQIVMVHALANASNRRAQLLGQIVEVVGEHRGPGIETEIAIRKLEIPHQWPQKLLDEVLFIAKEISPQEIEKREDIRHLPLITIDGQDARDFDDAIYCERENKSWRLIVAIADVAHYVKPGHALDEQAFLRGNSVYFPDRVIPMLPEKLSNDLCSLNPKVDRLCMICDMRIDSKGKVTRYRFAEAVMRSHARLTYSEVAGILLNQQQDARKRHDKIAVRLEELYRMYKTLFRKREQRGALDFEFPETKIIFGNNRKIKEIVTVYRNDAHRLIEECMLAANVCAADLLLKQKIPALYRNHDAPEKDKIKDLRDFLRGIGLSLGGRKDEINVHDYANLIKQIQKRPDGRLLQATLLRSFNQALYSPKNTGHFALAYKHYVHFTSPIRRYPDLLIHRAIKNTIRKKKPAPINNLRAIGDHCSMTERRAEEATREVTRWLKAEYMYDKIGQEFDGIITGVVEFGLFVELNDIGVDGLVHVSALGNDYYQFDPTKQCLIAKRSKHSYCLGQPLRVKLARVDLDEGKIDFDPCDAINNASKNKKQPKQRRQKKKKRKQPKKKKK